MKNQIIGKILLVSARVTGIAVLAFLLFFIAAHLFGEESSRESFSGMNEVFLFLLFPVSPVIGLLLALKWQLTGALISSLGMTALFIFRPDFLTAVYIVLSAIPGYLYLLHWLLFRFR